MDHSFAIENHTAERYLLNELDEVERDAYEEHFFCCPECADEIKSASDFIEAARHAVQNELKAEIYSHAARRSIWGSWLNGWRSMLQPFPAAACALLVAVAGLAGYQNSVTIPRLSQAASAQLITVAPILRDSRAEIKVITIPKGGSFALPFEIPPANYRSYEASVVTASGVKKLSLSNISAVEAKNPLTIFVPVGALEPGRYAVLVEGVNEKTREEVNRFPFELKFQD
jgi:hypothetical protein